MGVAEKQYKQLNIQERIELYSLWKQEKSLRYIARIMKRNVGTISRELSRNRQRQTKKYEVVKAHEMSERRRIQQRTKAPLKNHQTFVYVREKLRGGWSPELIAGRLPIDIAGQSIVHETIYQYIYGKGRKYHLQEYLTRSHKRRRAKTGRSVHKSQSRIPDAIMIEKRSPKADNRTQIGHFETDLMEGPRGTKTVLSVTVERKTRYSLISQLANKQAETKEKVLTTRLKTLQSLSKSKKPIVRSITADNGSENTNHKQVSNALGVPMYFCYPYHSWEKGSVENRIGVIRRFIPKGTPLYHLTKEHIQILENKINTTPMKCLNYLTPTEALEKEVNRYKFRSYLKSNCCTSK